MPVSRTLSIITTFILGLNLSAHAAQIKVIYGEDNREDVIDVKNSLYLKLAKSTAAMIEPSKLTEYNNEQYEVSADILSERGICKSERFSSQPSAAKCSGFLVEGDKLVTAGHCIKSQTDCDNNLWVFDYKVASGSDSTVIVDKSSVYKCKKVISQKLDRQNEADYALIQLEKVVSDRAPLRYRKSGKPRVGDSLVVIGHPSGLPTKIADGANIRQVNNIFFKANLDTYGGNSGSAVFNATTGYIEGILVRGETDYIYDQNQGCRVSNILSNTAGDGEDVTLITIVEGLDVTRPPKPEPEVPNEEPEVEPTPEPPAEEPQEELSFVERLLRLIFG